MGIFWAAYFDHVNCVQVIVFGCFYSDLYTYTRGALVLVYCAYFRQFSVIIAIVLAQWLKWLARALEVQCSKIGPTK